MAKKLNTTSINRSKASNNKANIPTQNNLSAIINAQVVDFDKVIKQIIKTASAYSNYKAVLSSIDNYRLIVTNIFSNDGIVMSMIRVMESVDAQKSNRNITAIRHFISNLHSLINYIAEKISGIALSASSIDLTILEKTYTKVVAAIEKTITILGRMKIKWTLPIKLFFIKLQFWYIKEFIEDLGESTNNIIDSLGNIVKGFAKFKLLETIVQSLNQVFDNVMNIKINMLKLWWKTIRVKKALNKVLKLVQTVAKLKIDKDAMVKSSLLAVTLIFIVNALKHVINTINSTYIGIKINWKIKRIIKAVKKMTKLFKVIRKIDDKKITPDKMKSFLMLLLIVATMKHMFRIIRTTNVGPFTMIKLFMFRMALKSLAKIIKVFNTIHYKPTLMRKLKRITRFFRGMNEMFKIIAFGTPFVIISVLLSIPLLVGALFLLTINLNIMYNLIKIAAKGASTAVKRFTIILLFISTISITMVVLAVTAAIVVSAALPILLFFGVMTLILGSIVGLGLMTIAMTTIIVPALLGVALITSLVATVIVLAGMLALLGALSIDKDMILNNVNIIFDCTFAIINGIFNTSDGMSNKKSDKTWLESVVSFLNGPVSIIKAILSIAFLATAVAGIFVVLLLAVQLRMIQGLNLDPNKIMTNVNAVINTSLSIIDLIFNKPDTSSQKSDKTWLESLVEFVGGPFKIIKAIMAVAFLAVITAAISFVVLIALQLRMLQGLDLDPNKIRTNVTSVLDTASMVVNSIFHKPDSESTPSDKTWLGTFLEYVGGPFKIIQAIMSISYLATVMLCMGIIQLIARQLKDIADIDLPSDITTSVNNILICGDQVVSALINRKDALVGQEDSKKKGFLRRVFSNIGDALSFMSSVAWVASAMCAIGMVSQIAQHLEEIKNFNNSDNILTNTNAICNTADAIMQRINEVGKDVEVKDFKKRLKLLIKIYDVMSDLGDLTESEVTNVEKATKSYVDLIESVNTMDVNRLKSTTDMFRQMANFSESINGNFEKLAEALSEKLLPVLEDLKTIVSTVPDKIDVGFQSTSASIAATTAAPTKENVTAQVNRENPNLTADEVDKIVTNRMNEKATTDANGVAAKLDEMISLLKGFGSGYVTVKTI